MSNINIYFFKYPIGYKWVPGDRAVARFFKRLLNIKSISGAEKVFLNLCKGLDQLKIQYKKNPPFESIGPDEPVIILGDELYNSKYFLMGYDQPNAIIAGIGLMTHPAEWPDLLQQYPVVKYLQHCTWANNIFLPYYGKDVCQEWPAGVDTQKWSPNNRVAKKYDILLYNKIRWNKAERYQSLRAPIIQKLNEMRLSHTEIVYGNYQEKDYFKLIQQSRAMIFICEHETQGFALCEALSANVPVLAWDPGYCLDPARFKWNAPVIQTTTVPFFDDSCGMSFTDTNMFLNVMDDFWGKVQRGDFNPRPYIVENLSLKVSTQKMLGIIDKVYARAKQ